MSFGNQMRLIRELDKLSQKEAAAKTGIDPAAYSRYEADKIENPGIDILVKLSEGFDVASDYFLLEIPPETQRLLDQASNSLYKLSQLSEDGKNSINSLIDYEFTKVNLLLASQPIRKRFKRKPIDKKSGNISKGRKPSI